MRTILFKDAQDVYRIRKEDEGCSIFTSRKYIEGDESLFFLLQGFNEKGVIETIKSLEKDFSEDVGEIKKDLLEMCQTWRTEGIFTTTAKQIYEYYHEEDNNDIS